MDKRLVIALVFVAALATKMSTAMFTSLLKMERMFNEEDGILQKINPFIDRQFDRLKKINKFIPERLIDVSSRAASVRKLSHPNAAYHVIKDFVTSYTDALGDNVNVFLEKRPNLLLANESDFTGAMESLVRLKRIYKLSITDMIKGDYLGFQGPSLSALDVLELYNNKTVREIDQDTHVVKLGQLCRHQLSRNVTFINTPQIVCRYREALLPYYRFKEELLSIQPFVSVIYDFVSDRESQHFIDLAHSKLERGYVYYEDGSSRVSIGRTGQVSWIDDFESDAVRRISLRIQHLTGLPTSNNYFTDQINSESFQVVNYGIGGHYHLHYDAPEQVIQIHDPTFLDRVATFLIYLNNVDLGGSTVFAKVQLAVSPKKNMALFWYNYNTANRLDNSTKHAGCPVVHGHKWIANKWIRAGGSMFRRRCGLKPDVTQLDIEEDMRRGYK